MEMKTTVDIPQDNSEDTAEHQDTRGNMHPPEMFMEEGDGKHDGEECFRFPNQLCIHHLCGCEPYIPKPEAYNDEKAEEKEEEGFLHRKEKQLPEHGEESVGEKDEEHDGDFPQKKHGNGGEDAGELPGKNGERRAAKDRQEEEEVSLPGPDKRGGHLVGVSCYYSNKAAVVEW